MTTKQKFLVMFDSFLLQQCLAWESSAALSLQGGKGKDSQNSFSIEILLAVVVCNGRCVLQKLKLPFVIRTSFIVSALRLMMNHKAQEIELNIYSRSSSFTGDEKMGNFDPTVIAWSGLRSFFGRKYHVTGSV